MARNDFKASNSIDKVRWVDLSIPLKIAVGIAYFIGILYLLIFIAGFVKGLNGG